MDHVLMCTFFNKINAPRYFRPLKNKRFHNCIILPGVFLKTEALVMKDYQDKYLVRLKSYLHDSPNTLYYIKSTQPAYVKS